MTNSLVDGLGGEELGQAGSQFSSVWVTGSVVSQDMVSGVNLYATNNVNAGSVVGKWVSGVQVQAGSVVGAFVSGLQVQAGSVVGAFVSGLQVQAGSVVGAYVSGATLAGANLLVAGSQDVDFVYSNAGSPYYNGDILQFTTETVISGGMWVTVSGAAGGASVLARAAAASTQGPIGVATATAGSNATVNVLTRGVTYLTAEASINNGVPIQMGGGAALNTVLAVGAGSGARGVALAGAGSEAKALVYLW